MRLWAVLLVLLAAASCESAPETPPMPPPPVAAPQPDRAVILTINFERNSWAIASSSRPALDNVAQAMRDQRLAGTRYVVQGHTDVSGRLGYNLSLSKLRAAAVVDYLASKGVERARLTSEGFGPLRPLEGQDPKNPANRRVEIIAVRSG
jgi:outer membrane protein OmpA-like peptidoglycan-associated protein